MLGRRVIFTHTLVEPIAPGQKRTVGSRLTSRLSVSSAPGLSLGNGEQISPGDYIFVNYPVFEETYQGVVYTKHSAVHEIPAERSVLPWTNDRNWYADTQATLIVTDNDEIHAQMSDSHTVMRTRDGGRTWDNLQVTKISEHSVARWGVSSGGTGRMGGCACRCPAIRGGHGNRSDKLSPPNTRRSGVLNSYAMDR